MDFAKNELTIQVAETIKQFAEQFIRPHVMEWDEEAGISGAHFKRVRKTWANGNFGSTGIWRKWTWLF